MAEDVHAQHSSRSTDAEISHPSELPPAVESNRQACHGPEIVDDSKSQVPQASHAADDKLDPSADANMVPLQGDAVPNLEDMAADFGHIGDESSGVMTNANLDSEERSKTAELEPSEGHVPTDLGSGAADHLSHESLIELVNGVPVPANSHEHIEPVPTVLIEPPQVSQPVPIEQEIVDPVPISVNGVPLSELDIDIGEHFHANQHEIGTGFGNSEPINIPGDVGHPHPPHPSVPESVNGVPIPVVINGESVDFSTGSAPETENLDLSGLDGTNSINGEPIPIPSETDLGALPQPIPPTLNGVSLPTPPSEDPVPVPGNAGASTTPEQVVQRSEQLDQLPREAIQVVANTQKEETRIASGTKNVDAPEGVPKTISAFVAVDNHPTEQSAGEQTSESLQKLHA